MIEFRCVCTYSSRAFYYVKSSSARGVLNAIYHAPERAGFPVGGSAFWSVRETVTPDRSSKRGRRRGHNRFLAGMRSSAPPSVSTYSGVIRMTGWPEASASACGDRSVARQPGKVHPGGEDQPRPPVIRRLQNIAGVVPQAPDHLRPVGFGELAGWGRGQEEQRIEPPGPDFRRYPVPERHQQVVRRVKPFGCEHRAETHFPLEQPAPVSLHEPCRKARHRSGRNRPAGGQAGCRIPRSIP